jgi:hypothetical protein
MRQALPLLKQELGGDGSSATVLLSSDGRPGGRAFAGGANAASGSDDVDADDHVTTTASLTPAPRRGHIDLHL